MTNNNQHGLKEFEDAVALAGFTRIYDIVDYEVFTRRHGMVAYIASYARTYIETAPNTRRCDLMVADHGQDRDAVRKLLGASMSVWARTPNTPVNNVARPKDMLQSSDEWFDLWVTFDAAVPRATATEEPEETQEPASSEEQYFDENGTPIEIITDESDTVVVARPLTMDERPNVTVPFEEIQRKWLDKLMGRTPRT